DFPPPPPKNHLKLVPLNHQRSRSTSCRKLCALIRSRIISRRGYQGWLGPLPENWGLLGNENGSGND
ncbi:hypothetical protein KJ987_08485, partial [bacterium]|nr:hypothetical protein [bacterium]